MLFLFNDLVVVTKQHKNKYTPKRVVPLYGLDVVYTVRARSGRDRETGRATGRETETDRQTGGQADRRTDRQTDSVCVVCVCAFDARMAHCCSHMHPTHAITIHTSAAHAEFAPL